jgi:integrase
MPIAGLNKKFVLNATCPDRLAKIEYVDRRQEGFFVEVLRSGTKSYYQRYVDLHGRKRQIKIGRADVVPLPEARKRAMQIKVDVSLGRDPLRAAQDLRKIPTLKAFALEQYLPHIQQLKRSWKTDEVIIRRHLLPRLGAFYLDEITDRMILKVMTDMRAEGYANGTCNRPAIFLKVMLNLARQWGILAADAGPSRKIHLFDEVKRQRFLSSSEMRALMAALQVDENQLAAKAIELLLLTGARRNEVTQARWEHVDLERNTLLVPLSKSGRPRTISLNGAAAALIAGLPSRGESVWLFPSPKTGRPSPALYYPWERVRKRAGLEALRLHDLRHSYASNLVNGGVSLYVVQQLLGHTNPQTTQRYAHLEQDTLARASEIAASAVQRAVDSDVETDRSD